MYTKISHDFCCHSVQISDEMREKKFGSTLRNVHCFLFFPMFVFQARLYPSPLLSLVMV